MRISPIAGPGAGVRKYDVLTALAAWGLRGSPSEQVTALRLSALITARYNWQRDELSAGQKEIARLWGVTDRTVKREVKRLTGLGLLRVLRPGVKGRVACYRLDQTRLAELSAPYWAAVGPDFAERFGAVHAVPEPVSSVVRVAFGRTATEPGKSPLHACLKEYAPEAYAAWFARLSVESEAAGRVVLACPNGFVRRYVETHFGGVLRDAVAAVYGPGTAITMVEPGAGPGQGA